MGMSDNTKGYNCIYCGQFIHEGESHYCFSNNYNIYETTEVQLLRQILNELQTIIRLLEEKK
jgi:hypothetical protein